MTTKQLKEMQADSWATRRRDGAKFEDIATDSKVTTRTIYNRLREFGYDSSGKKETIADETATTNTLGGV